MLYGQKKKMKKKVYGIYKLVLVKLYTKYATSTFRYI